MATPIGDDLTRGLCRRGQGAATCSFLGLMGGWVCLKGDDKMEPFIRGKRSSMSALGDNCSGPPNFTPTPKVT